MMAERNPMCTLYVARHGQTEWNVSHTIQGHRDSPLTPDGTQQAYDLAKELVDIEFDAIFSSDLLRARRTANIIALERELVVETTQALRERKLGKLEGTQENERAIIKELREKANEVGFENLGIEKDEQMISRLITFMREVAVAYPGKNVLLVTHGGALSILLVHLGFCSYEDLESMIITNTSYLKLESDGIEFFLLETKGIQKG